MSPLRFLRFGQEHDVARLTLARPPLNILTTEMLQEMHEVLAAVAAHPTVKVLVIDGDGKAFSAGVAVEEHLGDRLKPMLDAFHQVFRTLRGLECLTLAAVHGAALGGGAELAAFCDVVIASEEATFGQPEIKVGVFPPIAALHYPRRIGAARTLALLLSGEVVTAAEALRLGLADRVVPRASLAAAVTAQVERVRAQSAVVLRLTKRAVCETLGADFEPGLQALEDLYRYELMTTEDA
ncbi:MAG TPA: enoyl-CoA hydratase/isomerase family protein, partial [Methylomirabilota bacterium]|nr:enoyl-CoA hydratase/isomerase family protein [Methylomirabilota bacterium]